MLVVVNLETLIAFALVAIILTFVAILAIRDWWKQRQCKHERYFETSSCNAICSKCGKNLGFIGIVRQQRGEK